MAAINKEKVIATTTTDRDRAILGSRYASAILGFDAEIIDRATSRVVIQSHTGSGTIAGFERLEKSKGVRNSNDRTTTTAGTVMKNGLKIIDSDIHIMEPVDLWEKYLEPRFKDRGPRGWRTKTDLPDQEAKS